ncbi:MAG TPA: extracellular solute-binding protein [Capsulimonadaceae bacterium]|jgi:multiple sugar transport system substrate-binding protein
MKQLFAVIFVVLVLLSGVAKMLQPHVGATGKIDLVWTSDDNPARRDQIKLFNDLNPKYDCVLDPGNSQLQKVVVQSLAGVGPDLIDCYSPAQLASYVNSGIAWDVTDAMKARGIEVQKEVWSIGTASSMKDGRVYGFPTNVSVNALWLNKDIFAKEGIPLPKGPWTWDEFIPLAKKLTKRDAQGTITQYGMLLDWYQWTQFVHQWGGHIYNADGTRCTLDSPEAAAGVQFLHDLVYKEHVLPSPSEQDAMATTGGWGSGTITLFQGGHSAMALGGRWWLCTIRKQQDLHLAAVECPHPAKGLRIFDGSGRSTLINAKSKKREQAIVFLEYLRSKQYTDMINHQADGLGPTQKYCMGDDYLHDPAYPHEDFNDVWRSVMPYGVPNEISPYVTSQVADVIIQKQIDLIKADQKPVAKAMADAAAQVNAEIKKAITVDPVLRARYLKATGGKLP